MARRRKALPRQPCPHCGCIYYRSGTVRIGEYGGNVYVRPAKLCRDCKQELPVEPA
jgi:hypothetical protein